MTGKKSKKRSYNAQELVQMLRAKYGDSQRYAVFEQVANGTGYGCRSWVDAAVVNLWPSDGLIRRAFEVKVSRADFLNELARPEKNAWARASFNEFWFVAPDSVIKEEELPAGAGWMCPRGDILVIKRNASTNVDVPIGADLFASLARSAIKGRSKDEAAYEREILEKSHEHKMACAYRDGVKKFLSESGVRSEFYSVDVAMKEVYRRCREVSYDSEEKRRAFQLLEHLDHLQRSLLAVYESFAVVTFAGLFEVDKSAAFVQSVYSPNTGAIDIDGRRKELMNGAKSRLGTRGGNTVVDQFDLLTKEVTRIVSGGGNDE